MPGERDLVSEIEQLIDELESFAEKSPWYLPSKIVIRDEDFFRITQRVRELLPVEIQQARDTLTKRDLILKNAQEEHQRILQSAQRRLDDLTSEEQVVILARQEAERIIDQAKHEAATLKRDALVYTSELLQDMEKQFAQTIASIKKGREFIETEIQDEIQQNLASEPAAGSVAAPVADAMTAPLS